jgi:hypothetical protein
MVMTTARKVIGALLIIAGGVWVLQGINIIPGSFMTGQTKWALYGAVMVFFGLALMFLPAKRRDNTP